MNETTSMSVVAIHNNSWWPKKVSHYQNHHSLNRIENRQLGYIFHQFWVYNEHKILLVCTKYSMCDLICDVITCCVWSCDKGKINIEPMTEPWMKTTKEDKIRKSNKFVLHKYPSKRWFSNGIHRLLRRTDVRGKADIIYGIWRISLLWQARHSYWGHKVAHPQNI